MRRSREKVIDQLPKLKMIEIGYKHVFFITLSVLVFFMAPIYFLSQQNVNQDLEGQVAGISTSKGETTPVEKLQIFLQDKNNQLLFVGTILTTISGTSLVMLAVENSLRKK